MKGVFVLGSNLTAKAPRGIKKISEAMLQDNRAMILTEESALTVDWNDIPYGTIKVDTITGVMSVKLKGALLTKDNIILHNAYIKDTDSKVYSIVNNDPVMNPKTSNQYTRRDVKLTSETDWLPCGIKNDGTLCITKDSIIESETFTINSINRANNTFTYLNENGSRNTGTIDNDRWIFTLEKGSYVPGRNQLDIFIDGLYYQNNLHNNIDENTTKIKIAKDLEVNQKVLVKYIKVSRIGNPYPRVFMTSRIDTEPANSENGDLWLYKTRVGNTDSVGLRWKINNEWISLYSGEAMASSLEESNSTLSSKITSDIANHNTDRNAHRELISEVQGNINTALNRLNDYLPLTGGTVTGDIHLNKTYPITTNDNKVANTKFVISVVNNTKDEINRNVNQTRTDLTNTVNTAKNNLTTLVNDTTRDLTTSVDTKVRDLTTLVNNAKTELTELVNNSSKIKMRFY